MKRKRVGKKNDLEQQVKNHIKSESSKDTFQAYKGNFGTVISTGSTLLDLAISGKVVRGGGMPGGILVEAFGPSGSGKTVLLCEVAGYIQRQGGEIMFNDPEARLNTKFAELFDLDTSTMEYATPDKIPEVFKLVRDWEINEKKVNGVLTDSLAALSTDMEMDKDEGDKMGMRRAKEFSEELRRTCRLLKNKNLLMVASNQVRVNQNAGPYGQKYVSPGGEAIGFYASLRLRFGTAVKIKEKKTFKGKAIEKVVGVETEIEVFKSSVDEPYRKAPLIIYFEYGIDDIRANLQFVKKFTNATTYQVNGENVGRSLDEGVKAVEEGDLETELKEQTIDLWELIESKFTKNRKKKQR